MAQLTNADRANLIDALGEAMESISSMIDSNLCVDPKDDDEYDKKVREEWRGQIKVYRQLRRRLLAEERRS